MSIAITEDHRALAETAADFLERRDAKAAARALLEAPTEELPDFWKALVDLGWLGLHVPEDLGGSGYGLEELVVVVEELGRVVAPGPFVPTVIASAVLVAAADDATKARLVPGLADGSTVGRHRHDRRRHRLRRHRVRIGRGARRRPGPGAAAPGR